MSWNFNPLASPGVEFGNNTAGLVFVLAKQLQPEITVRAAKELSVFQAGPLTILKL
jgi:hypothetical protein